jgi:hypothetical protein
VLIPPKRLIGMEDVDTDSNPPKPQKKSTQTREQFQSDLPQYVRYDDLARSAFYRDTDLFVICNPHCVLDIVVAVMDFRNLKGTEQGPEG